MWDIHVSVNCVLFGRPVVIQMAEPDGSLLCSLELSTWSYLEVLKPMSTYSCHIFKFILIFSSYIRLSFLYNLFTSLFPSKILHAFFILLMHASKAAVILFFYRYTVKVSLYVTSFCGSVEGTAVRNCKHSTHRHWMGINSQPHALAYLRSVYFPSIHLLGG